MARLEIEVFEPRMDTKKHEFFIKKGNRFVSIGVHSWFLILAL
jgi:hypothetical protein